MELQLLKTLLSADSYRTNQPKLKRSIFSDDHPESVIVTFLVAGGSDAREEVAQTVCPPR